MKRSLFKKITDKVRSIRIGATIINSNLGYKSFISKNGFVSNTEIGAYTSVGRNTTIINTTIGKYCSISWNVTIGATQHPFNHISSHAFSYIKRFGFVPSDKRIVQITSVGNDVWFGANSIIMPGITIGHGAVIGAGSVVTKDVPSYAIVAGVPAKVIKYRFSQKNREGLVRSEWWNLEQEIIKQNITLWQGSLSDETMKRLLILCK